jgi:hypothetical protein
MAGQQLSGRWSYPTFHWFVQKSVRRRKVMSENDVERSGRDNVRITLIIVIGIIILVCILAFTVVAVAFLLNAPWGL